MKQIRELVVIEWGDAWSGSTWTDSDRQTDAECQPVHIFSVGWIHRQNKKGIYLAARIDPDGDAIGNRCFIPRSCITKITKIHKHRLVKGA